MSALDAPRPTPKPSPFAVPSVEFRVIWKWLTDDRPERVRVYKTRKGAEARLTKLRSNGGRFTHVVETEPTRYDDGYSEETLELQYARLEWREVGHWLLDAFDVAEEASA